MPPSQRNSCMCILGRKLLTQSKTFTTVGGLVEAEGSSAPGHGRRELRRQLRPSSASRSNHHPSLEHLT